MLLKVLKRLHRGPSEPALTVGQVLDLPDCANVRFLISRKYLAVENQEKVSNASKPTKQQKRNDGNGRPLRDPEQRLRSQGDAL